MAAAGEFERAETIAENALELAQQDGNQQLANAVTLRIELFRQRQPYRDPTTR